MGNRRLQVFVSSKMEELAPEREMIKDALKVVADAWVFEKDAGSRPTTIQETFLEEVEQADIYVGIFWKGYGDYTIEEFEQAQKLEIPCLVYEKRTALDERDAALQAFLDGLSEVETGVTIQWFDRADELGEMVRRDVVAWLTEMARLGVAKQVGDVPLDLLPKTDYFTGREGAMEKLEADLKPGEVVTITGPGGMGKTALASEVLYRITEDGTRVPERFPDGVISYSFYGKPEVSLALEHIVRQYGVEAKPSPEEAAEMLLPRLQALLVMDGAEEADDLEALLERRGRCCVLVTSRSREHVKRHESWQDLPPLDEEEAQRLLQAWGRDCVDDPQAAEQIRALVGGLPLALRLVGKYLIEHGERASEYLAWLQTTPLEALDQGERRRDSVPLLLEKSLEQVGEESRSALGVVGLLGLAPFEAAWIQVGMAVEKRAIRKVLGKLFNFEPFRADRDRERLTRDALGELVKFGLLKRTGRQYEVSHALVHTYASEAGKAPEGSLKRLVDALGTLATEANKSGLPEEFKPLRGHVRALAERAEEAGSKDAGWLWNSLGRHLDAVAEYAGAKAAYQRALAIDEAVFGRDHPKVAIRVNNLGLVLQAMGDHHGAKAAYQRALAIVEDALGTKHPYVATTVSNLGEVLRVMGDHHGAKAAFQRALAIDEAVFGPDHPNVARDVNNLGNVLHAMGDHPGAKAAFQRALRIIKQYFPDDHPHIRATVGNLASLDE